MPQFRSSNRIDAATRTQVVRALLGFVVAGCLCGMAVAAPPPGEPRQVLRAWMSGVDSGDTRALRRLTYINSDSDAQTQGLNALMAYISGRHELYQAARQRFDAAADRLRLTSAAVFRPIDDKALDQAVVTYDRGGQVATIALPNEVEKVELRLVDGEWRVVVDAIANLVDDPLMHQPEFGSQFRIDLWTQMAAGVAETRGQLLAGKLATIDATEGDLIARLRDAYAAVRRSDRWGPGPF